MLRTASVKGVRAASSAVTVANGIKVIASQTAAPIASVSVHVAAGSAKTTHETAGVPHLLTHLTLKETANRTQFRLTRELEATGSQLRVSMDEDGITYTVNTLPEKLERTVELVGDVVSNPALFDWTVKDVAASIKTQPDTRKSLENAFMHSGVGAPMALPEGYPVDVDAVKEFVGTHYVAGNVTVGAAGAGAEGVAAMVEKYFSLPEGTTTAVKAEFNPSKNLELSPASIGEVSVVFGGDSVDRANADVVRHLVEEVLSEEEIVDVLVHHTTANSALCVHAKGDAATMSSSSIIESVKALADPKNVSADAVAAAVDMFTVATHLVETSPDVLSTALSRGEAPADERAALAKVTPETVAATIAKLTANSSVTAVGRPSLLQ